jgi:hypothetical protein
LARGPGGEECCRGAYENDGEEAGSFEQGTSGVIGLLKHTAEGKLLVSGSHAAIQMTHEK